MTVRSQLDLSRREVPLRVRLSTHVSLFFFKEGKLMKSKNWQVGVK
jgi:hypothetical protein